jgi:predicted transcriptional regulator
VDAETQKLISSAANAAAIPVELWVRIAVEASRLVSEIAGLLGQPEAEVRSLLSCVAESDVEAGTDALAGLALVRYAEELRHEHPRCEVMRELPMRLPEEMNATWRRAAAQQHSTYATWIATQLAVAPGDCVEWEIAAARNCKSLGEWAYASSLRASTSSSA